MAVSNAERRAVILALLAEFDEDYGAIARFIRALRTAAPTIAWQTELDTQARGQARAELRRVACQRQAGWYWGG